MSIAIHAYYDFRSPYAYFANQRVNSGSLGFTPSTTWVWRPVSIDVLLNLQSGRDDWAAYADPLSKPKRDHLIADVRRSAAFYGIAIRPPNPPRPNSIPALCVAALLEIDEQESFRNAVFEALWQQQRDIADPTVLTDCLGHIGRGAEVVAQAMLADAREALARATRKAYAKGVFGVPTFVYRDEVYFGNDRLEMLKWRLERDLK